VRAGWSGGGGQCVTRPAEGEPLARAVVEARGGSGLVRLNEEQWEKKIVTNALALIKDVG